MQDALAATLRQTFILSQGISCKKQRARSEDRHQIKPFPTAQLDETINLRCLTSLLFPEMGYATPIRNFYTSSGDKLDLKFAKIWHSIIPINSITKSWERLRCFTDTHQNNQTCHCRREDSSYWARRPCNVGTRSGLTFTAERSSYCWLVPCTISNALRWQWIPRIGVIHKNFSSLQYFLRSLSNFIHPPRRSYPTRLSTICSRDYHTVLRRNLTYSLKASTPCCHRAEELVRRLHIDPGIQQQWIHLTCLLGIIVCNIFLGIHPSIW